MLFIHLDQSVTFPFHYCHYSPFQSNNVNNHIIELTLEHRNNFYTFPRRAVSAKIYCCSQIHGLAYPPLAFPHFERYADKESGFSSIFGLRPRSAFASCRSEKRRRRILMHGFR